MPETLIRYCSRLYSDLMAKVMISLPESLLERIDRESRRRSVSRSGLLREAALRELGRPDSAQIEAALDAGRAALEGLGSFDSTDVVRADRDARDSRDRRRL